VELYNVANLQKPVYAYGDTKILFKLIQDGEKTPEEKKRQEDGVRAVVQYCQNEIDCRRVQVLGYFGQVFDRKDCHKRCNNCLENGDSVEEDMSKMAAKAILLVKDLLSRDKNVTKLHCLDVFRGANIKAIRDKGHDRVTLFGAGSTLNREQGERLFDHLLSLEGFHQVSVANKSGWNTLYMQVWMRIHTCVFSLLVNPSFSWGLLPTIS
jgi:superfamily II DNA helicase RecQ